MIRGDKVGLAPPRREHAALFARWMSDLRVTRTLAAPCKPMTIERELAWLDQMLTSDEVLFTIYELSTMRPIGNTGLHDLDETLGTAEFGIMIGEPDAWGKGFATEATKLMLAYAFDVLGLYNVMLGTYAVNPAAVRAYEKAGFRHIGVRRGAMRIGRERCDVILMEAVADDFPPSDLHALMQRGG
jgi:RimJ/RimL family protein N-acetyltransferase